ncbi:hypothetical protein W02_38080 [Nitrospira sp. KM1]|uniref:VPLPA-CTERM sorting domain-containing protein n=1 Tax=Nitrospira sp. KM1 TaxID=1936990 RepID=UPI0013A72FF6|nr:VPLPA-CTERM sorting domain-containing protein [Nitrospira sp. KM1]BCA56668.1 hypothetical protein W02_38080 [Nitrospira sp. KM1]
MNRMKSTFTGCMLGLGLVLTAGQSAYAAAGVWDNTFTPSSWTRQSTPGSLYAEWNTFGPQTPAPLPALTNPDVANFGGGSYSLLETTGAGSIFSSGNISRSGASGPGTAFEWTVGNVAGGPRDVYMRIGSLGAFDTTLNQSFTNFTLNGVTGTYQELFNGPATGGAGSREVEALISWLNVPDASSFLLTWNAIGVNASLDQLSLDVGPLAPVPLPAAVYLMASGLMGIAAMARRQQRAV